MRRSLYFTAPRHVNVRSEPLPAMRSDQMRVNTLYSAISAGTEMLLYSGKMPADLTLDATISSLNQSSSHYPVKYGYAAVGQVTDIGDQVDKVWLGKIVFAFNPHESHFLTTPQDVHLVPADIPPEAAVFLPNMETAVSFAMDGQPIIGERAIILGQGIVGLLTTGLLSSLNLDMLVTVDGYAQRREMSLKMGADYTFGLASEDSAQLQKALSADAQTSADLVYELSGNPRALNTAIELTGFDGRIIVGSWYGQKQAELNLGGRFHRNHIKLISSQVSHLNPKWRGRWTKARRLETAWRMIKQIQPQQLITHRFTLDQAPQAYQMLVDRPQDALQIIFTYPSD